MFKLTKNFILNSKLILNKNTFVKNLNSNIQKNLTKKQMEETARNELKEKQNYIVWVDLEMSGLNLSTDHILEMACLITDKDLNIVAEGPELIINQADSVLDGMNPWCVKTHGESGLTQACRDSKISIQEAEEIMLSFLKNHVPKGSCPLAGNTVHVDRQFLEKYMNKFLDHLHYRIIDVSTIKELSKRWYPSLPYFPKKNTHRALDDIKESIAELKHFRQTLFKDNI